MTRYRCHACGRPLIRPAYLHPDGWALGPVCFGRPENLPADVRAALRLEWVAKRLSTDGYTGRGKYGPKPRKKPAVKPQKIDENQFELELQ